MKYSKVSGRIYMAFILLFLYAPIFILIIFSFNDSNSRTVWAGFTLRHYKDVFLDSETISAFQTTIVVSVLAAAIATIAGTVTAVGLQTWKKSARSAVLFVNNIPLTNADIITGVAMCLLFVTAGAVFGLQFLGFSTMLIAHITFNIPYVILSVMPKMRQLDPNLVNAGRDLGCTWFGALRRVILPEIMPGVVNGAIIAFTMSIDDFVISYFTAGSSVQTLSMRIYAMTRKRISLKINALSTLLFAAVLILLVIINLREMSQEDRKNKIIYHGNKL